MVYFLNPQCKGGVHFNTSSFEFSSRFRYLSRDIIISNIAKHFYLKTALKNNEFFDGSVLRI